MIRAKTEKGEAIATDVPAQKACQAEAQAIEQKHANLLSLQPPPPTEAAPSWQRAVKAYSHEMAVLVVEHGPPKMEFAKLQAKFVEQLKTLRAAQSGGSREKLERN